jgi:hypothetical protein
MLTSCKSIPEEILQRPCPYGLVFTPHGKDNIYGNKYESATCNRWE